MWLQEPRNSTSCGFQKAKGEKDDDQNTPWRFLTMLFNIGYILMEWNILSST